MKLIGAACCLAAMCTVGLGAQTSERKTTSKVSVKDGKDVTVVGCVEPTASGEGYMLTGVADKHSSLHSYMLVSDDVDLASHVGQRVEIKGRAADRGEGKIETETTTKSTEERGGRDTKRKTEVSGDLSGLPFLGVQSLKMIAGGCGR